MHRIYKTTNPPDSILGRINLWYVVNGLERVNIIDPDTNTAKDWAVKDTSLNMGFYVRDVFGGGAVRNIYSNLITVTKQYPRLEDIPSLGKVEADLLPVGRINTFHVTRGQHRYNVELIFELRTPMVLD